MGSLKREVRHSSATGVRKLVCSSVNDFFKIKDLGKVDGSRRLNYSRPHQETTPDLLSLKRLCLN